MISACVMWRGATKPFFVNDKGLKANSKTYWKYLDEELLSEVNRIKNINTWIFIQDSASSHHGNIFQDFLKEKLGKRFIKDTEWPPSSQDCNLLDYYFWNKIKESLWRPIQPIFWKLKWIVKKDQKSLPWNSAWPDWTSQSFKAIFCTSAKSGRRKKGTVN